MLRDRSRQLSRDTNHELIMYLLKVKYMSTIFDKLLSEILRNGDVFFFLYSSRNMHHYVRSRCSIQYSLNIVVVVVVEHFTYFSNLLVRTLYMVRTGRTWSIRLGYFLYFDVLGPSAALSLLPKHLGLR